MDEIMVNIRKLEAELWEAADLLRQGSKVTSHEYCMPVLGLIFLRYAFGRFKFVEGEILKDRPVRNGRVLPVSAEDFRSKSAIYLPEKARYETLVNLPNAVDVGAAPITDDGIDFKTRMAEIHAELLTLQAESNALMETLSQNMKTVLGE